MLVSTSSLSNPDWINLYLSEPTGSHISDFPETINCVLRSSPIMSGWSSKQLNEKFLSLLSTFGRFWIKPSSPRSTLESNSLSQHHLSQHHALNDLSSDLSSGELFYRTTGGVDILVKDLSFNCSQRSLIVRVNGMVIPTICLAQLKVLLQKYGDYHDTLRLIHQHWAAIEDAIEKHRVTFNY